MRPFGVVSLLLVAGSARADIVTRAAAAGEGGGTSAMENDLIAWAGQPRAITLPELLQSAVRLAPALQNARLVIAIAEAQIAETWERHAWHVQAQLSASKGTSFFSGLTIASTQYGGTADLFRTLPTGATVDLHVGSQYTKSASVFSSAKQWVDTASISVTQPLLKAGGTTFYNATEHRADLIRDVDVLARRLAAIQAVQTVISGY